MRPLSLVSLKLDLISPLDRCGDRLESEQLRGLLQAMGTSSWEAETSVCRHQISGHVFGASLPLVYLRDPHKPSVRSLSLSPFYRCRNRLREKRCPRTHQKKTVQPRQVCWEPPAAVSGWQVCRKQATDGHGPALEKSQTNRAFGKPAARLWANVPFLSTDYTSWLTCLGRKGMQTCRGQLLMQGTLSILCGRPHVL